MCPACDGEGVPWLEVVADGEVGSCWLCGGAGRVRLIRLLTTALGTS